jgi:predicted CDP-diglyceride synthetase/phosphatidate cytidylyltransferase
LLPVWLFPRMALNAIDGLLDRLDSVIFSAPIIFHLTRSYWTV